MIVPKRTRRPFPKLPLYVWPRPGMKNEATAARPALFCWAGACGTGGTYAGCDGGGGGGGLAGAVVSGAPQFSQNRLSESTLLPQLGQNGIQITVSHISKDSFYSFLRVKDSRGSFSGMTKKMTESENPDLLVAHQGIPEWQMDAVTAGGFQDFHTLVIPCDPQLGLTACGADGEPELAGG